MKVTTITVPTSTVTEPQRKVMFKLMADYYEAMTWEQFEADLADKDDIIILTDAVRNTIIGFSTLKTLTGDSAGKPYKVIYSGDTVVDRAYWGQRKLGREFLKYLFIKKIRTPFTPVYWLLISKGYKTYLLMANNFREHYPRYESPTPPAKQRILTSVAQRLFGAAYNRRTGLISFDQPRGHIRRGVAEISKELRQHPRVFYFLQRNPAWHKGEELVCLANMTWTMPIEYLMKSIWKLCGHKVIRVLTKPLFNSAPEPK